MSLSARMSPLPAVSARPRERGMAARIACAIGLLVAAALGHVHLRLQVIEAGYALSREGRQHHDLFDQNQKLRIELATRRDPAVIARRARDELQMAPPTAAAIRALHLDAAALPPTELADRSAP